MSKPILCVDFDGVIHSYVSGWHGANVVSDPPVPGVFEWLESLLPYFTINIYSSRSSQPGGIQAMVNWFIAQGAPLSLYEWLHFPAQKPAAFLTIDDRCICFDGKFPPIYEMQNFIPWNKTKRASELEWLQYFYSNVDFGPAHDDVIDQIKKDFMSKYNKQLPYGYTDPYED